MGVTWVLLDLKLFMFAFICERNDKISIYLRATLKRWLYNLLNLISSRNELLIGHQNHKFTLLKRKNSPAKYRNLRSIHCVCPGSKTSSSNCIWKNYIHSLEKMRKIALSVSRSLEILSIGRTVQNCALIFTARAVVWRRFIPMWNDSDSIIIMG